MKTIPIAQDVTGADGHFTLRVDPSVPLAEYTEEDGTINIDLLAEGVDGRTSVSLSRRATGGEQPSWVDPTAPDSAPAAAALTLGLLGQTTGSQPSTQVPPDAIPGEFKDGVCQNYTLATYDQRWTAIGETYPGPSATAQFQYKVTSTSTLGVGVSASNSGLNYSQSGTSTNSWSSGLTWPKRAANTKYFYWTTFQYKKFDVWVFWDLGCTHWDYQVRPTSYQGGVSSSAISSAPTANNCSPIGGPVLIHKTQGTAVTWTNGVSIASYIGVDLSSKTGFDTDTSYDFNFTAAGRLCGSNTTYPQAAQVVGKGP